MIFFAIVFVVPLLIALGFWLFAPRRVNLTEFLFMGAAALLVAGVSAGICYFSNTHDVEHLNGRVTGKKSEHVSCRHDYKCFCHEECSGSGKDRRCSEVCQTCYEHSYDVDWNVFTNVGSTIQIDRIDRQGISQPPRWTAVYTGEPVSVTHWYTNYVKGAGDTLFKREGDYEKFTNIPAYPGAITDYYRGNKVVSVGVPLDNPRLWVNALNEVNADLGPLKQANVVLVFVKDQPREWFYALEKSWVGGKKNDIVVVTGADSAGNITWVETMAWTNKHLVKVKLDDDILALKTVNGPTFREEFFKIVRHDVAAEFVRKPMADYQYLSASITPTAFQWSLSLGIALVICIGLGIFFYTNDPFNQGDEGSRFNRSFGRRYYR